MKIAKVRIENFRGIKSGEISFTDHTAILGANNAGKTTIAEALAILVGREKLTRPISDWDFFGGEIKPNIRFYIIGTIIGLTPNGSNDPTQAPHWFCGDQAARPAWWHSDTRQVSYETDPPAGTQLAAEIAVAGRFNDESFEFETVRYFHYGDCDPFADGCKTVPMQRLRDLGLFLLPGHRQWDHLLSFSSSTFLKVVKEYEAIPADAIEALKNELRNDVTKAESSAPLSEILEQAERELKSFLLIEDSGKLAYRPTQLDTLAVMKSLVAHLKLGEFMIPVANHGSGMICLQSFLILLAFAAHRRQHNKNFILVAEEPELHLHPALHQRLVQRIRASSTQSIVTTQSPHIAASYLPADVVFLRNKGGKLGAVPLRTEPIAHITSNSIKKLYQQQRPEVYSALMGGTVIIPEGESDFRWLTLLQRFAQAVPDAADKYNLRPISIIPTNDGGVVETFTELSRLRNDAIALVDGDVAGQRYMTNLTACDPAPARIVTFGNCAAIECLVSWILQPSLASPGCALIELLPDANMRSIKDLQDKLCDGTIKKGRDLHERLVWDAVDNSACCERALEFFHDLSAIAANSETTNPGWQKTTAANGATVISTASHIVKV